MDFVTGLFLGVVSRGVIRDIDRATRAATGVCPLYAALDLPATSTTAYLSGARGQHIREEITVAQPVDTVFAFWRQLSSIGEATRGKITVDNIDATRSRWQLRTAPDGVPLVEWTAELINEVPGKVLGWRTTGDADVVSAGGVNFLQAPGSQGTEVRKRRSAPYRAARPMR